VGYRCRALFDWVAHDEGYLTIHVGDEFDITEDDHVRFVYRGLVTCLNRVAGLLAQIKEEKLELFLLTILNLFNLYQYKSLKLITV
jgi:hypothetical protein